jgi:hypothetical protein
MNTSLNRFTHLRKGVVIAFSAAVLALALPTDASAQGVSADTPIAEQGQGKGKYGGSTAPVPEPATWATLITLAALGGGLAYRSMKKRQEIA